MQNLLEAKLHALLGSSPSTLDLHGRVQPSLLALFSDLFNESRNRPMLMNLLEKLDNGAFMELAMKRRLWLARTALTLASTLMAMFGISQSKYTKILRPLSIALKPVLLFDIFPPLEDVLSDQRLHSSGPLFESEASCDDPTAPGQRIPVAVSTISSVNDFRILCSFS